MKTEQATQAINHAFFQHTRHLFSELCNGLDVPSTAPGARAKFATKFAAAQSAHDDIIRDMTTTSATAEEIYKPLPPVAGADKIETDEQLQARVLASVGDAAPAEQRAQVLAARGPALELIAASYKLNRGDAENPAPTVKTTVVDDGAERRIEPIVQKGEGTPESDEAYRIRVMHGAGSEVTPERRAEIQGATGSALDDIGNSYFLPRWTV